MRVEFTEEQFRKLLDLAYLGNWMINSHRSGDIIEAYDDLQSYLFQHCPRFGMEELLDHADESYPSVAYEEEVSVFIDEYDDETLWEGLAMNLATKRVAEENVEPESALDRIFDYEAEYLAEFEENGLKNLPLPVVK